MDSIKIPLSNEPTIQSLHIVFVNKTRFVNVLKVLWNNIKFPPSLLTTTKVILCKYTRKKLSLLIALEKSDSFYSTLFSSFSPFHFLNLTASQLPRSHGIVMCPPVVAHFKISLDAVRHPGNVHLPLFARSIHILTGGLSGGCREQELYCTNSDTSLCTLYTLFDRPCIQATRPNQLW